jgi:hypothetical protein
MLRNILAIIALVSVMTCGAKEITQLEELTNKSVVTIKRLPEEADSCGYLSYIPTDADNPNYKVMTEQPDSITDNQLWVIYHQVVDQAYYLYNLASQRCLQFATEDCDLSATASAIQFDYEEAQQGWIISDDTKMLGLSKGLRNAVYFLGNLTSSNYGIFFKIEDNERLLTDEEILKMEDVIGSTRKSAIESYRAFLATAKAVNADGYTNYCGSYDIADLEEALKDENVDNVPLPTLAALKKKAIDASYPLPTAYYRIKNYERPTANSRNNYMTLNKTGLTLFAQNSTVLGVSNLDNNGENLRLFQFHSVDGLDTDRRRIRIAAVDKGLQIGNKDFLVTFLDNDEAKVFQLVRNSDSSRLFKLQYNGENKRLTTNGVSGGQGIAINTNTENAMLWYLEKVEDISGPTLNAAGFATTMLPCQVDIPDGIKAYYIMSISNGNIELGQLDYVIPAYTPCILRGDASATTSFHITENIVGTYEIDNLMEGTTYYRANDADIYTLDMSSDGSVGFTLHTDQTELKANSAYIPASAVPAGLSTLYMDLDNIVTGITPIVTDSSDSDSYYDINGLRVTNPAKGSIVIDKNGNKQVK